MALRNSKNIIRNVCFGCILLTTILTVHSLYTTHWVFTKRTESTLFVKPGLQKDIQPGPTFYDNGIESEPENKTWILQGRWMNQHITDYNEMIRDRFRAIVKRKAPPADPEVIHLARLMLDPPSQGILKPSHRVRHTPQSEEVKSLLNNKQNGFFVEVGGLDGERSSNTLALEQRDSWTGLLIEMDPYYYTQLRGKSRKSWSINACLSTSPYPVELEYLENSGGAGRLVNGKHNPSRQIHTAPCFPLESLLLALNQTHVDFFSLDVEGKEMDILKTIDFKKLNISVLTVEYGHGSKDLYTDFMTSRNYTMHKDIHQADPVIGLYVEDFVFVKNKLT